MFKPTILIGTLLVSHLAGVCCAMAMPAMNHHGMMNSGTAEYQSEENILTSTGRCGSEQMENTSFIERDQGRGCIISERMKSGNNDGPDYVAVISGVSTLSLSAASHVPDRHRYQGASPPELLNRFVANQMLL